MRLTLAFLTVAMLLPVTDHATADPYRWCAVFGSQHSGSSSCYSVTWEQCMATVSGVGGFCMQNNFYDGKPVRTPEDGPAPRRRARVGN
jgi:uncharacterized protein DUF3551